MDTGTMLVHSACCWCMSRDDLPGRRQANTRKL